MLMWALRYLQLGFSLIPLRPCGKEPLIKWEEYQKRKPTEQEVREWWTKWPDANVGIVTGALSALVIVDLDGPEGLQSAHSMNLHSRVQSVTGSGKHLWYRHPGGIVQNSVRSYPGLDVRGDGGYIVAPPSVHKSGRRYRFITPLLSVGVLPLFPKSLIYTISNGKTPEGQKVVTTKEESWVECEHDNRGFVQCSCSSLQKYRPSGWIAKALEEMKDGNIDNTFVSILGRLRHDGWDANSAKLLLEPHARRVGAEEGHLEAKIENIWNRYEAKPNVNVSRSISLDPSNGLVIHSPTNPDSIKQFEQLQVSSESSGNELFSGYSKLDQMLQGGLKSSRLFTIAARTGVGKTNFLIGISRALCEKSKRVLLFSTEMPYAQIWERYIQTLKNPEDFKTHAFFVCDSFAPNLERVEEAINEIKPDVFMFDHINHVAEDPRELGTFMQGLNYLRRKYDMAGIISAQLNRSADWVDLKTGEKVTPRMSMIKGSGTIEQASSRVLLLSETRVLPEYTEIVGNLDKNDNGPKGLIHFGLMNKPYKMIEL